MSGSDDPRHMSDLFPGFITQRAVTSGAEIHFEIGGSGPPLLLLHGFPQTHAMWHKVAPALAHSFTVVCADLRGYGDSSKPPTDANHAPYSKRAMALDMVEVMRSLGFDRFAVGAHDRGARVAHRMCVDHPDVVSRAALLDICPTRLMYAQTDFEFAKAYYHWFFLIQPFDMPERMIGAQAVRHARPPVVARDREAVEPERAHHLDHVLRHGALGVRRVIGIGGRLR